MTAAGIVENFVAHEYPTEKIKKLLDINIMGKSALRYQVSPAEKVGTWFCALEAARLMPEGGSITMIGSMSGSVSPTPHHLVHLAGLKGIGRQRPSASDTLQLLESRR